MLFRGEEGLATVNNQELSLLNDDEWMEYIMKQYEGELIRTAFAYLREWSLSEDVIQEVYIKCFLKRENFRADASLKTWVFTILKNTCKDVLRSVAYNRVIPFPNDFHGFLFPSIYSTESYMLRDEEQLEIKRAVLSLPVKYRDVIVLFNYEGFSIKEISSFLQIKESTIKTRLKRGREKVRENLLHVE